MDFIVIDLEWNGSFVKKVHGYFNEIIEIGAVKLDSALRQTDTFHAVIHPAVSKKLTELVTNLTSITDAELTDGGTFPGVMAAFRRWVGKADTVILTWSTTDLLVLLENYRYFCHNETIPFMTAYVDLQAYYQSRQRLPAAQQVGLSAACEQLGINAEDVAHHRALGDSILTGRILQQVYEAESFEKQMVAADAAFYRRLTFKNSYITDITDRRIRREYLQFLCESCQAPLTPDGKWRPHNRSLCTAMTCAACGGKYIARVQVKQKYEAVEVKRRLALKKEDPKNDIQEAATHE